MDKAVVAEAAELLAQHRDLRQPLRIGAHQLTDGPAILHRLREIYQGPIAYDLTCLPRAERHWLTARIEAMHDVQATASRQKQIARLLVGSEAWDRFMGKRFGQVKRYGLEGCESLVVALDAVFQVAEGVDEAVLAMAHRGRLNVMVGLLGYPAEAIFHKLQAGASELAGPGTADVLSHLSISNSVELGGKMARATLLPNSSHLESVNPIAQGWAYGQMKGKSKSILPIQVHGDAAFNGQGISQETMQMSVLEGFAVGGTLHIMVNNQLGFTTPAHAGRSCKGATDMARVLSAPVFRVNADRPEEVARCAALAMAYRQHWGKDVFLELVGYRRNGHNELDEPAFTQPHMYSRVRSMPSVASSYTESLIANGITNKAEVEAWISEAHEKFDSALGRASEYRVVPSGLQAPAIPSVSLPSMSDAALKEYALASTTLPESFTPHQRLARFHIEGRKAMLEAGHVDWATAEAMAAGSLLQSGVSVRLCGQDVGRGTFSQRHWQLHDQQHLGKTITPLGTLAKKGARLEVVNSHLSEFAVTGFEYGLSLVDPERSLCIWEAQFGDFFNGAQIIWDAYVSSGEQKWALQSGLVVLLPHGYDGAGPEHSSARIERWLQMCDQPIKASDSGHADVNMVVAVPTTAANYFHLLRRQVMWPFRRPLIVASPKTLLRLPSASSPLSDLVNGGFRAVIGDESISDHQKVKTVTLVSGKLYYELVKEREVRGLADEMAIIRIEEICPFPMAQIKDQLALYPKAQRWVWCQEEPENMGAYSWIVPRLAPLISGGAQLEYVGRPAAAAPAVGYSSLHKKQIAAINEALFRK